MKKLTITLAVLVTGLVLAACGSDDESQPATTTPVTAPAGTTAVTGATGLTGTTGTTGASGTTGTTPSGTSPTTEQLDGNQMGDQNGASTAPSQAQKQTGGNTAAKPSKPSSQSTGSVPRADPSFYTEP